MSKPARPLPLGPGKPIADDTASVQPDIRPLFSCDCCGQVVNEVSRCWVTGIETFACNKCRHIEADEGW